MDFEIFNLKDNRNFSNKNKTIYSKNFTNMSNTIKSKKSEIQNINENLNKYRSSKLFFQKLYQNPIYICFFSLIALYNILGENIKLAFFDQLYDQIFLDLSLLCISFCIIDLVLNYFSHKKYFCSFFFWLDIISTISQIMDLDFISNSINSFQIKNKY